MQPYGAIEATHIRAAGPCIEVGPRAALAISMALHELATNATKYGALSQGAGSVEIIWSQLPGDGCAELVWTERGGPPVHDPGPSRGFGLRLLTQGLASDLGKPAQVSFDSAGLTCTLVVSTLR